MAGVFFQLELRFPGVASTRKSLVAPAKVCRGLAGWTPLIAWGLSLGLAFGLGAAPAHACALSHQLPSGGSILKEGWRGDMLEVYLDLPEAFLLPDPATGVRAPSSLDALWLEGFLRRIFAEYDARGATIRGVLPLVRDPRAALSGWPRMKEWRPLRDFLPPISPVPKRRHELERLELPGPTPLSASPVNLGVGAPGQRSGALSGKVVYVSQGHGFTWSSVLGRWSTQRDDVHGIVEDLVNAEAVNHYLLPYLRNAGATVFTTREHDMNPEMVIVDADAGGVASLEGAGSYTEESEGATPWTDGVGAGFRAGLSPYLGQLNPFTKGTTRVTTTVGGEPSATARWVPYIPVDGHYGVYVSYAAAPGRGRDAHYTVIHPGGHTHFRVDQRRHGSTWLFLGTFYFRAGSDPASGAVMLSNDSELDPGATISADALRFGGGMGDTVRGTGIIKPSGPVSERLRWEECARYYAQFSGAPSAVYDIAGSDGNDDVSTRSRFAAWLNEEGEDAVYVSWHTNAPNPGRGTSTYVYGPNSPNGSYQFTGAAGSDLLAQSVHSSVVARIRAEFDPEWKDRGIRSAWFGEVNPSHNDEMPSILVEVGFHDTEKDALLIREPRFRKTVARAFYEGIVAYFAARDGEPPRFLPGVPRNLGVRQADSGRVRITWSPPEGAGDPPTGYRVYKSLDGSAFDNGVEVAGALTSYETEHEGPGVPLFFRVAAYNAGGESFPTPVIPVMPGCDDTAPETLLVHGFYSIGFFMLPIEDMTSWYLGHLARFRQREVNSYDYLVQHAEAFAAAGVAFDGAEATAVEEGVTLLGDYRFVDWALGEESSVEESLSDGEQARLVAWLADGGERVLWANGSELLWDLGAKGSPSDVDFMRTWLGVDYGGDDAGTYGVSPGAATWAAGIQAFTFDDGQHGSYDVDYPDILLPLEGAEGFLHYDNGAGVAGAWYSSAGFSVCTLGFPLETVRPLSARDALVALVADRAELEKVPAQCSSGEQGGGDKAEPPPDAGGSQGADLFATDASSPGDIRGLGDEGAGEGPSGPSPDVGGAVRVDDEGISTGGGTSSGGGCSLSVVPFSGAWIWILCLGCLCCFRRRVGSDPTDLAC